MSNHPPTKIYAMFDPVTKLPGVGYKRYYYQTGTTTPKDTYYAADLLAGHENPNPVTSDANGQYPEIHLKTDGAYRVVEKDAAGVTLLTTDDVWADRLESSGAVSGSSSSATAAVTGTNTSTGPALKGVNSGAGPGAWIEADTTTPVKAALHIVPQDSDASSPVKGDLTVNSVTGLLRGYDGAEAVRYVANVFRSTAKESRSADGYYTAIYSIPPNTLVVGSVIRVSASGYISAQNGTPNVSMTIKLAPGIGVGGELAVANVAAAEVGDSFSLEACLTVGVVGAVGKKSGRGVGIGYDVSVVSSAVRLFSVIEASIDTTLSNLVFVDVSHVGGVNYTCDLCTFVVDIS